MNNNQDLVNNENNIINNYIKKLYTDECSSFTDEPSNVCSSDVIETCGDCCTAFPQKARRTYQRKS